MGPLRVMIAWLMTIILCCDIIMAAPADNYGDSSDKLSRLHDLLQPRDILSEIRIRRAYGPLRNNYRLKMFKKCIQERRSGSISDTCQQFFCANGSQSYCPTVISI